MELRFGWERNPHEEEANDVIFTISAIIIFKYNIEEHTDMELQTCIQMESASKCLHPLTLYGKTILKARRKFFPPKNTQNKHILR